MVKKRLWQYLFCLGLLCCSFYVNAQYVIEGQVLNTRKEPVANASIKIKDSAKGLPLFFSISNEQGQYRILIPANKRGNWLECSLLGYRNTGFALPAPTGNIIRQNIVLIGDTAALPEINVFSTPPITVSGDTTTFKVDAFKKGNESNVSDLLNALPGFSVNNGRISYNGRAVTKVLIEEDDLFGSDYNTITQNLSPRGIEKIQLIENYNDKTYLSNRLKKGDELVVNLKFNKKYLYRIITSNEAGLSLNPAAGFYKVRQNIVSLIPRIKSVTTTNFNNTGLLASEILGTTFNLPELQAYKKDAINFDLFSRFSAGPVAQMPDISSSIVPKNRMVNNHTSVVTNNSLYKPSKKLQLKTIFQYYRDAFNQQQLQTVDYAVSGLNLQVQNKQFLQKQLPVVNGAIETVYSPSTYTQLVYKANISTQNETDSLNNVRQLLETYTRYKNSYTRFQQQLGFSFSLDSNRVIDLRAFQNTASSNELPIIYPANLYAAFTGDTLFSQLHSSIQNNNTEYNFQAKFTFRKKTTNWSVELLHGTSNASFNTSGTLTRPDSLLKITDPALMNNAALKTRISSVVLTYNTSITKTISLHTTQQVEAGRLLLNNGKTQPEKNYVHYLPSIRIGFLLNKNNQLNLNADFRNKLPPVNNLGGGYVFSTDNRITQGNDSLQVGISKSVSLSYTYTEMVKRKLIFFSSLYYTRDPAVYLTNTLPSAFYTVSNLRVYGKDITLAGAAAHVFKYVSAIKSQVTIEANANRVSSFYSTNNKTGTVDLSTISGSFKIKTLITDKLTSNLSTKAAVNNQAFDKGSLTERKNENTILTYTAELIYRFNTKWLMSTKYQDIHQEQGTQAYSVQFAEVFVKYFAIKDKFSFMLTGNNLLNNGRFTNVAFTQNSINTQTIFLIKPFWMLHVTLEL